MSELGTKYQYTHFVMQDIEGLIKLMGGVKIFEKWVDDNYSTETDTINNKIHDI
jgi:putative alpha-1,2-mannosidase